MKRQRVVIAGVIVAAALVGGTAFWALNRESKPEQLAAYWDEKSGINQADNAGNLPLIKAVQAHDMAAVQYLIAHGADVDAANREGLSATSAAAAAGDATLFETAAAASKADFKQPKFLDKALDGGNAAIVKSVLARGGDANAVLTFRGKRKPDVATDYKDPHAITPLKKAIASGNAAAAKVLLDAGADGAEFFLTEEIGRAKTDMVKVLAEKSGDLSRVTVKGMDLLAYATGMATPETLRYLIDHNAGDINGALRRLLSFRDLGSNFGETVSLFLEKGARPTALAMELMLKKKQPEAYKALAQCSPEPNLETSQNMRMFGFAVDNGYADSVRYLLDAGGDMWAAEKDGRTPIGMAVRNAAAQPEIIKLLEAKLASANETGYNGETLPMLFAGAGDEANFMRLAANGGDIYKVDNDGKTVLMYAAEGGNQNILEYLLAQGLLLAAKDNAGRTALMYAAGNGKDDIVAFLAEKNVRLLDQDFDGKTVLMYAAEKSKPETADLIIDGGESLDTIDKEGRTALMYAAENGNEAMVRRILEAGGDVNRTDNRGMTALAYAAKNGNIEVIKMIRNNGGDLYLADKDGRLPAVYAMERGDFDAFQLLSDSFMSFDRTTAGNGKTFLMYAIEGGDAQIIRAGLRTSQQWLNRKDRQGKTALMYLVEQGRADLVRDFISHEANAGARDNSGKTVLMYAAQGRVGVNMVTLLQTAWDVVRKSLNVRDNQGMTALMYAVSGKSSNTIKQHMLLTHGENPEAVDNMGRTVLMHLVGNSKAKIETGMVEELLNTVKRIDQNDDNGKTALMYAAGNPTLGTNILDLLVSHKANIDAVDNAGKSVLMYAVESGDIGKVRYFIRAGAKTDAKTTDGRGVLDFAKGHGSCFAAAAADLVLKKP